MDEVLADLKRSLELNPQQNASHIFVGGDICNTGAPQDALAETEQERMGHLRLENLAIAYHSLGRKKSEAALQESIAKYHTTDAYQIAEVYAFRNQPETAFEWLDRAYTQRDGGLVLTKVDPLLKSLHNDPRFAAPLKNLDLPIEN